MDRTKTKSSSVASHGYDAETETLEIEHANGSVYRHKGVPKDVAEGFHSAESVGKYFNEHIKGKYEFEKL